MSVRAAHALAVDSDIMCRTMVRLLRQSQRNNILSRRSELNSVLSELFLCQPSDTWLDAVLLSRCAHSDDRKPCGPSIAIWLRIEDKIGNHRTFWNSYVCVHECVWRHKEFLHLDDVRLIWCGYVVWSALIHISFQIDDIRKYGIHAIIPRLTLHHIGNCNSIDSRSAVAAWSPIVGPVYGKHALHRC